MFDATTQYDIDENFLKLPPDVIIDRNGSTHRASKVVDKGNEELYLFEIKNVEAEGSEAKYSEKALIEEPRRLSGLSDFNDLDCGEPFTGQHLKINFGVTDDDSPEVEKKCRSFWKFIESHPHLEKIKVYPTCYEQSTPETPVNNDPVVAMDTATQWIKNDELIKTATKTKIPTSYCHLDRGDYCAEASKTKYKDAAKIRNYRRKGVKEDRNSISIRSRTSSAYELKSLYKCMEEWDAAHPHSKNEPGPRNVKDSTVSPTYIAQSGLDS